MIPSFQPHCPNPTTQVATDALKAMEEEEAEELAAKARLEDDDEYN